MTKHRSISWMLLLGLPACGLGGYGGPEVPAGKGRVAVSWRQSGAPLTAEACAAAGITHMDVQVTALATGQQVTFTEVDCALDRYLIFNAPEGAALVEVGGVGGTGRGRCFRRYGQAQAQIGTATPTEPLLVELQPGCK